ETAKKRVVAGRRHRGQGAGKRASNKGAHLPPPVQERGGEGSARARSDVALPTMLSTKNVFATPGLRTSYLLRPSRSKREIAVHTSIKKTDIRDYSFPTDKFYQTLDTYTRSGRFWQYTSFRNLQIIAKTHGIYMGFIHTSENILVDIFSFCPRKRLSIAIRIDHIKVTVGAREIRIFPV